MDCSGDYAGTLEMMNAVFAVVMDLVVLTFTLSLGEVNSSGSLEILYDFGGPVGGFQFDVTGVSTHWRLGWCCR